MKQFRLNKKKILASITAFTCMATLLGIWQKKQALAADLPEHEVSITTPTGSVFGSLEVPDQPGPFPVVLIIAGSGPTDRNGNQPFMKSNAYQLLAEGLKKAGIASLRYDKRGIGKSKAAGPKEKEMRFEHFAADAQAWIDFLRQDSRFNQVIVLGHSEGSLLGMLAAREARADGYISLAGAGHPAAEILKSQLTAQSPKIAASAQPILDQLSQGQTVKKVPLLLKPLFRDSVQPYMISWFRYDPRIEIAKLSMPVLIVQGKTDIQVSLADAEALHQAIPDAQYVVLDQMNHILKDAPAEKKANIKTYNQPQLPLSSGLLPQLTAFIQGIQMPVQPEADHVS